MTVDQALHPGDSRLFRDGLGHFPTGVVVVTALGVDGRPVGMAVGSFTSVSLKPPPSLFFRTRRPPASRGSGKLHRSA